MARIDPALRSGWTALRETLLALSEQTTQEHRAKRSAVRDHLERVRERLLALEEIEESNLRPLSAARGADRRSFTDPLPLAYGSHAQAVEALVEASTADGMSDFELEIRARALVRVLLGALEKRERWLDT